MNLILSLPSLLFIGFLFVLPILYLFQQGFSQFQLSIFHDPFLLGVIRFTYWQAALSASLSLLFGFFSAFLIQEWKVWGSKVFWRVGLLCSSLPSLVVALGILGAWGSIFGWAGVLMGHVFLNFAIPMRLIGNSLRERNQLAELTALSLGMSRLETFFKVTLPEIKTSVWASWLISFLYCSTSLFIVLFLGGGPRFTTLEVSLYEAIKLNLDLGKAVQIASLQVTIGILVFVAYVKCQSWHRNLWIKKPLSIYRPQNPFFIKTGSVTLWAILCALVGTPLFSVVRDGLIGMDYLVWKDLLSASKTSLAIASSVVMLSLLILYPYLHWLNQKEQLSGSSFWSWLVALPQFFSSLVVALALSVFYSSLRSSFVLSYLGIVITQVLFVIPLIQFPLRDGFMRLTRLRNQLAQSLGASPFQRWVLVEFPFMKRYIFLSILIAGGFSMGEVVSILLFSPPGIQTLSSSIFQSMSRYRFQEAHAYTIVLLIWMLVLFGVAGFLEEKDE